MSELPSGYFRVKSDFFVKADSAELTYGLVGEYFSALANKNNHACAVVARHFKSYSYSLDLLDEEGVPVYEHEHDEFCMPEDGENKR